MRLLIVSGLPATGKTTLARELARHFGVPLLCKDSVKEPLMDTLGWGDPSHSRQLSGASFAVLFKLAEEIADAGSDLILEGNFRAKEHEQPLRALKAQTAQILCEIDESERRERIATRPTDPSRHPGHQNTPRTAPDPATDRFLNLPGERFVFESGYPARKADLMKEIDRWWQENRRV